MDRLNCSFREYGILLLIKLYIFGIRLADWLPQTDFIKSCLPEINYVITYIYLVIKQLLIIHSLININNVLLLYQKIWIKEYVTILYWQLLFNSDRFFYCKHIICHYLLRYFKDQTHYNTVNWKIVFIPLIKVIVY